MKSAKARRTAGRTKIRQGHDENHEHPNHDHALSRLRRIQGQIAGIESMIEDKRYCVDILVQFRAAMAALRNLEAAIFETHLRHCVSSALTSHDRRDADKKVRELTQLLSRRTQL